MFENDTPLPFRFKNKEIKRESYTSKNRVDEIKKDEYLIEKVYQKSKNFSDDKPYKIMDIENGRFYEESQKKSLLKLNFNKNKWSYNIEKENFEMPDIDFDNLFKGKWDFEQKALRINFKDIEKQEKYLVSFEASYSNEITLDDYGKLKGKFQNISIMPKTKNDAEAWLLYLLKKEIEKKERYISKDELHYLWLNLLDTKPQLDIFDLEFNFEKVLQRFGKDSKYYWLLQSGIDLYPFNTGLTPKNRVIIDAEKSIDLINNFVQKFNIDMPKELTIVDRWIVDVKQFRGLEKVIKAFGNPKVTIITQDIRRDLNKNKKDEIENIIERNNIRRITKEKNEIVHSRYWIFDNEKFYKTNNSLDVIKVEDEEIEVKEQTTFDLYDTKDIENELINMLGEIYNG